MGSLAWTTWVDSGRNWRHHFDENGMYVGGTSTGISRLVYKSDPRQ